MNHAEYTEIPGLNWSTLKHLAESPKLYKLRVDVPEEDKEAYVLGRALHCLTLEPHRFAEEYAAQPYFGDGRTKEAKEAKAKWEATKRPGVAYLKDDDYAAIVSADSALRQHRVAKAQLSGVRYEELVTWTDEATGLLCKGRMDCIGPNGIVDLKSARRLGRLFFNDAASYRYHGQLAFYHDGAIAAGKLSAAAELPVLVAVQLEAPWDVMCCRMTEATLEAGRALYRSCLRRFQECQAADVWPGAAPDMVDWDLPGWAGGMNEPAEEPGEVSF